MVLALKSIPKLQQKLVIWLDYSSGESGIPSGNLGARDNGIPPWSTTVKGEVASMVTLLSRGCDRTARRPHCAVSALVLGLVEI